jgi:hypothetical protein
MDGSSDMVEIHVEGVGAVDNGGRPGVGVRMSVGFRAGRGGQLGGPLVGTGLIEVSHVHGDGRREMAPDLCRGEVRPGSQVAGINGGAPGGQRGGEKGGMIEGDFGGQ